MSFSGDPQGLLFLLLQPAERSAPKGKSTRLAGAGQEIKKSAVQSGGKAFDSGE